MVRFRSGQKPDGELLAADASGEATTATPSAPPRPRQDPAVGRHSGVRLGDLLVQHGALNADDLAQALLDQGESGRRLGEILVDSGFLTDAQLMQALSEQLQLPLVDLRRTLPTDEAIAVVPEAVVRSIRALPMRVSSEGVAVAMAGPPDAEQLETLERAAGTRVSVVLAPASDISRLIDRSYRAMAGLDRFVQAFQGEEAARPDSGAPVTLTIDDSAPVVQVVTRILTEAVRDRASDIHIEPQGDELRVRFRVDGALHDATVLPGNMAQALVSRLKIMAGLNIVERRRAQDGQFEVNVDGRPLDVRIATTATIWGEKAVLRILDKSKALLELGRLGLSGEARDEFSRMIRTPFGMVICAGPTGSGKTTTLYAALTELNDPSRNITTIEDPVEYIIPSINQIQINEAADVTFAGGLRSILRQDPDIILVGEVRDVETARIAVQSALTGHLVLSSLHATDAAAALHRFLDMGIEAFLVASSVIGVVAQRLVRRTCQACKEAYEPTAEERAFYEEWGGKPKDTFLKGTGCNLCLNTGYVERIGVYEILHVTEAVRSLLLEGASHDELRAAATADGMRTLRDEALRLIEEDITTISEVVRSIYLV